MKKICMFCLKKVCVCNKEFTTNEKDFYELERDRMNNSLFEGILEEEMYDDEYNYDEDN